MHRFLALLLLFPLGASAFPRVLHHQGRLSDSAGAPLTGAQDITFALYSEPASGTAIWTETLTVDFDAGYFSVDLGAVGSNPLDDEFFGDNDELWLALAVDGGAELPQRIALRAAPWAVVAGSVSGGTVDASSISINGDEIIGSDGVIDWSRISGAPSNALDALGCADGQVAQLEGTSWVCSDFAHEHDAADITGGTLSIARIPIGTDQDTVAEGNHTHTAAEVGALPVGTTAADIGALPVGTTAADIGAVAANGGGLTFGDVPDADCKSGAEGTVRWAEDTLQVCDGTEWLILRGIGSASGKTVDSAGASCKSILDAYPASATGTYWINGGGSTAWQTQCDMTLDGGGWTLVAYAGDNSAGFPRMDIDVGSFNAEARAGKSSRGAVAIARASTDMAVAFHTTTNHSGSLSDTTDTVSFAIPDPAIVDFKTSGNNGTCEPVAAKRLRPSGSDHMCVGNSTEGTTGTSPTNCNPANGNFHAGVWSRSLGGTYSGNFAYGLYTTEYQCNSWPNVSHHWWVDAQYYNWEPSATQYWPGSVNGATSIWLR